MKRTAVCSLALLLALAAGAPGGAAGSLTQARRPANLSAPPATKPLPPAEVPGSTPRPVAPVTDALPRLGDGNGNGLADDLDARLATAGPAEELPVVVLLSTRPTPDALSRITGALGAIQPSAVWEDTLYGFAARLTRPQIETLSRHPLVERVDLDREVTAFLDTATTWAGVAAAQSDFDVDGDRDGNPAAYSGTDVVIAVIDTGIDAAHVDLDGGKVIGWYDAVSGRPAPYDDHGHGTHVAGIAAGTGEGNAAYRGVAPGAALVGIKVLNRWGSGSTSGIISGIDWMVRNRERYGIRIANMSLGAAGCSDGTDSLSRAVSGAVAGGIIMAVAAGNSGPATCTIGSPGAAAEAITVAALYDPRELGWVLAEFSSRGPTADGRTKPDIAASGRNITAPRANSGRDYVTYSGTSMATPFLAGIVALMLDANYALTDSQVKAILFGRDNVKDFGPAGQDLDFGYGITRAYQAVQEAGSFTGRFGDDLNAGYGSGALDGTGSCDWWQLTVTDATKPIGITFVTPDWRSFWWFGAYPDFDIYLYDPEGNRVAGSAGLKRQEQILYQPTEPGTYLVRVYSYWGSGDYWFSVSWK